MFKVGWYGLLLQGDKMMNIDHDSGFTMMNTTMYESNLETCALPSQYEKVFYSEVLGKPSWSYIVRYDPRGRPIKYNPLEEEDNVEEEGDADQEQLATEDVSNEEFDQEVDHPNDVADDFELSDDIEDECITENEFDDDVDMSDPFNDSDFELDDDTYVESLDEDEYQWHCSNVGIQEVCG